LIELVRLLNICQGHSSARFSALSGRWWRNRII